MALGLGLKRTMQTAGNGVTLRSLLENPVGFPTGYLPSVRIVDGVAYINTYGKGKDADNMTVFYKWIFINPADLSATPDSTSEFAKIPESGCIMRIKQRSLLPYHENFVIDYYEDINNVMVIGVEAEAKQEFQHKKEGSYRTFRIGDMAVPAELKNEIYELPEVFFKEYIEDCIPLDLIYRGKIGESNHINGSMSYGDSRGSYKLDIQPTGNNMPYARSTPSYMAGRPSPYPNGGSSTYNRPSPSQIQDRINSSVSSQGGGMNGLSKPNKPMDISQTGLRYRTF